MLVVVQHSSPDLEALRGVPLGQLGGRGAHARGGDRRGAGRRQEQAIRVASEKNT